MNIDKEKIGLAAFFEKITPTALIYLRLT